MQGNMVLFFSTHRGVYNFVGTHSPSIPSLRPREPKPMRGQSMRGQSMGPQLREP